MAEARATILRALQVIALAVTATLPLVCLPGVEAPFSLPKVVLLVYWTAIGGLFVLVLRPRRDCPLGASTRALWLLALAWILWVSLSATFAPYASASHLLIEIAPVACFFIFVSLALDARQAAAALVLPAALVALIACLQRLGADPFSLFGWAPALGEGASGRLRIYATLGNPDFVAAYLCGIAPLWWSMAETNRWSGRRRFFWLSVGPLLALGILATGSRIPLLAGAALALWRAVVSKHRARTLAVLAGLLTLVVVFSPARPLRETAEGRLYIWRVALPHALEAPVFGFGPGSFELKYAQWETAWLSASSASDPERRFAGLQDHAHNDYLEILVEHGVPGLAVFLATCALGLAGPLLLKSDESGVGRGAAGGILALMACAFADFPLHRPTELFVFWTLLATICLSSCSRSSSALGQSRTCQHDAARAKEEPV